MRNIPSQTTPDLLWAEDAPEQLTDVSMKSELDWAKYCVRRDSSITETCGPDLSQYQLKRLLGPPGVYEPDFSQYHVERCLDIPPGQLGSAKFYGTISAALTPPDISKGLGKRQEKRDLAQLEQFVAENLPLMVYCEKIYFYNPPFWRELNENQTASIIRSFLEESIQENCLIQHDYHEIYRSLIINPRLRVEEILTPPKNMINMLDGTFDLQSKQLLPHVPEDHFFTCINVHGKKMSYCKGNIFEAFVRNCSDGDSIVRELLLQLTALTILRKPLKHFFVLLGESNTGKTQFGRFLEELVGLQNSVSVRDVNDFADRWTPGSLAGKMLATCLDLPDHPLPKSAVGIVKQLVGDDTVKGEKKYHDSFKFYQKPLLLFAGNHPLQIPNMAKEQALLNRMIIIPFRNPVPESDMKQELYKQLLEESPYIVREAICAYQRLEQNNFQFSPTELPPDLMPRDSRAGYRSIKEFLQQRCIFDTKAEICTSDLYRAYCTYAEARELHLTLPDFSRCLSQQLSDHPDVESVKRAAGTDSRGIAGFALECNGFIKCYCNNQMLPPHIISVRRNDLCTSSTHTLPTQRMKHVRRHCVCSIKAA